MFDDDNIKEFRFFIYKKIKTNKNLRIFKFNKSINKKIKECLSILSHSIKIFHRKIII